MPHQLVTVVIPTYNGAPYIRDALYSIFKQNILPSEIIVVDDYSTDNTTIIIESMITESPCPLFLIRQKANSGGPAHPMNVGCKAAKCDLIVLMDQDDLMAVDRISELSSILIDHPSVPMAFGRFARFKEADGLRKYLPSLPKLDVINAIKHVRLSNDRLVLDGRDLYSYLITYGHLLGGASNIAIRKSAWQAVGGFRESESIVWDYDFSCRMTKFGPIGFTSKVINSYRHHSDSLSANAVNTSRSASRLITEHLQSPVWPLEAHERNRAWKRIAFEYFSIGYEEARCGRVQSAIRNYWDAMCSDHSYIARSCFGICKIPVHWISSFLHI